MAEYRSPIYLHYEEPTFVERITQDCDKMITNAVIQAVQKVGIDVDRRELLKALQYDRGQYEEGYQAARMKFERPKGEWKNYSDEGYVECPFCESATCCDNNIDDLHYCFSCGADMRGEEE